jgi:hypothetical protein
MTWVKVPSRWIKLSFLLVMVFLWLPGFDDSSWSTGSGGLGFGDEDDNTLIAAPATSVYQRISFDIPDVSQVQMLIFSMDYDDGFVAYLNGVEIARSGLTGLPQPAFDELASSSHEALLYQGGVPTQFSLDEAALALLVNGSNVLCVETHNFTVNSTDLSSRPFLHLGLSSPVSWFGPIPSWVIVPVIFTESTLPIVVIQTNGVAIPDAYKIDAVMGIIHNGPGQVNHLSDPMNEFFGDIGIEIRGSTSAGFPAKSYGLETRGPIDTLNYNVSLFNWPVDNDWILYAPYNDKSMIRNVLTYKLGNEMGAWAPRTQLCEVMLNDQYQGVYVFMERIKQGPGRVDVDPLTYQDTLNNGITGGYIVKIDKTSGDGVIAWTSPFLAASPSAESINYQLHDPELAEMHPSQLNYIQSYITQWETALQGPDFLDPVVGYRPYVDVPSFIDFLIINELTKNVDGYRISTFLHKERFSEGGKLKAGPLWDFNLAFGNANYCYGSVTSDWDFDFNDYCSGGLDVPFWWQRLMEDSVFVNALHCRWFDLRQSVLSDAALSNFVDSMSLELAVPAQRHFSQWPILGVYVWPNNFVGNTFQEEMDYMKSWILERVAWMDSNMPGSCSGEGVQDIQDPMPVVFPNPAQDVLYVQGFLGRRAEYVVYDMAGNSVRAGWCTSIQPMISVADLAAGVYGLTLKSGSEPVKTIKWIKL